MENRVGLGVFPPLLCSLSDHLKYQTMIFNVSPLVISLFPPPSKFVEENEHGQKEGRGHPRLIPKRAERLLLCAQTRNPNTFR